MSMLLFTEVCPAAVHEAIKADPDRWSALPFIGIQACAEGDDGPCYSLRNCGCGSTLAQPIDLAVVPDRRSSL